MAEDFDCIACRLRKAIQDHYPAGMTVDDAVEAITALAQIAGEALADANEDQIQSFVTLVLAERQMVQAEVGKPRRTRVH